MRPRGERIHAASRVCLLTTQLRAAGDRVETVSARSERPSRLSTMTAEIDAHELRDAVERMHGCPAQLEGRCRYPSAEGGRSGIVYVFDLAGHRSANRCYAWSSKLRERQAPLLLCSTRRLPRLLMQLRDDPPGALARF